MSSAFKDEASQRSILHHSSFRANKKNYQEKLDGRIVVRLSEGDRLVILGSYGLKVIQGELAIGGATLRPDSFTYWVHAPYCHALPVIRVSEDSVAELHPHPTAQALRNLEELSPAFGKLWNEPSREDEGDGQARHKLESDTFQIIYTSEDGPKRALLQELASPAEWNKKLAELSNVKQAKPQVTFICGPKSSGKSTYGKLLANRLLTHQGLSKTKHWPGVAILDLDPGQPEYSAPGVVSLVYITKPNLSPPFCHPVPEAGYNHIRSHAIASVTPALDPQHYMECALDLYEHYRNNLQAEAPLIINTPGWIQGTGLDILVAMIANIKPSEVIYMSRDGPEEAVGGLKMACGSIPFSTLPSQASEYTSRTASHFRTMQTMSYFHVGFSSQGMQFSAWDSRPVSEMPPLRVRYRGPNRGFLGLMSYDYQPPPSLLAEAVNGMVVALVVVEDIAAFEDLLLDTSAQIEPSQALEPTMDLDAGCDNGLSKAGTEDLLGSLITRTPEGIPFIQNSNGRTLSPRHSRILGLALIRGIDTKCGEFQVLTPVPVDVLSEFGKDCMKLVMVAGKFDAPYWAYSEELYKRSFGSEYLGEAARGGPMEVADEGTDDDAFEGCYDETLGQAREHTQIPWVEMLHGSQKRSLGSRVWRVRRDLGKSS